MRERPRPDGEWADATRAAPAAVDETVPVALDDAPPTETAPVYHDDHEPFDESAQPLVGGTRWYRAQLRKWGWLAGVVPMAVIGAAAWLVLRIGDGRPSGLFGLAAGVTAAPGLLVVGAPFADNSNYPLAVAASVPLWFALGFLAARRATVSPVAAWKDYSRELLWLTIAVAVGAGVALVAATWYLGESLVV